MNFSKFYSVLAYTLLAILIFTVGCDKDDDDQYVPEGDYVSGIFIVNEGTFGAGNGSITHATRDGETVTQNIFQAVNGIPLGDVVNSLTFWGDSMAFIVVNNSQNAVGVNSNTFKLRGTAEGLPSPRFLLPVDDNTAYVRQFFQRPNQPSFPPRFDFGRKHYNTLPR